MSVGQASERRDEEFEYSEATVAAAAAAAGRAARPEQGCSSMQRVDPDGDEAIERRWVEIARQAYGYPVKAMEVVVGVLLQHCPAVWPNRVSTL